MKLTIEQIKKVIRQELENSIGQWKSIYGQSEPGKSKVSNSKEPQKNSEESKGE